MGSVFVAWVVSAVVIAVTAIILGAVVTKAGWLGILVDERGRFSLTRFQLILWTILVLSLIIGVFWGRVGLDASKALEFDIPSELLGALGISLGSAVLATTIKTVKDSSPQAENVAASDSEDRPRFSQMFLVEEGSQADKVIDVTKFQNFWITVLLIIAYAILAGAALRAEGSPEGLKALPGFGPQFLILLGISHAGYLVAKVPNKPGTPDGLTVAKRDTGRALPIAPTDTGPLSYVPRNPRRG